MNLNNSVQVYTNNSSPYQEEASYLSQKEELSKNSTSEKNYISKIPPEIMEIIFSFVSLENRTSSKTSILEQSLILMVVSKEFYRIFNNLLTTSDNRGMHAQVDFTKKRIQNLFSKENFFGKENILSAINKEIQFRKYFEFNFYKSPFVGASLSGSPLDKEKFFILLDAIASHKDLVSLSLHLTMTIEWKSILIDKIINLIKKLPNSSRINFYLENNEFDANHTKILGPALKNNVRKLFFRSNPIMDDGIVNLAPFLKNTSISALILENISITIKALECLSDNLLGNIKTISLSENNLGDSAIPIIIKILKNTENLNLSYNNITNKGMIDLLISLENYIVKKLILCKNKITGINIEEFFQILEKTEINEFDLRDNNCKKIENKNENGIITKAQNKKPEEITILSGKRKFPHKISFFSLG